MITISFLIKHWHGILIYLGCPLAATVIGGFISYFILSCRENRKKETSCANILLQTLTFLMFQQNEIYSLKIALQNLKTKGGTEILHRILMQHMKNSVVVLPYQVFDSDKIKLKLLSKKINWKKHASYLLFFMDWRKEFLKEYNQTINGKQLEFLRMFFSCNRKYMQILSFLEHSDDAISRAFEAETQQPLMPHNSFIDMLIKNRIVAIDDTLKAIDKYFEIATNASDSVEKYLGFLGMSGALFEKDSNGNTIFDVEHQG